MICKLKKIFSNINFKLYFSLLIMGLCPTIYNTLRIFWIGEIPSEYSYSIAGQLSWINLIYEIVSEAIILPLFFFIGKVIHDKNKFVNRIKTGLILTMFIYFFVSVFVIIFIRPLLNLMAISTNIMEASIEYIRLEAIANVFGISASFVLVVLISLGNNLYVYILTLIKLILVTLLDLIFISNFSFSLKLGVNGIALSNIVINILILISSILILYKQKINLFKKSKLDFKWMKEFFKVGGISGLESLIRNLFYMLMICRMVNVVGEQGSYWVANSFIWGWLLLPIIQLGELIKQEVSTDYNNIRNNIKGYFIITTIVCVSWFILMPLYKPFMRYVLNYDDVNKLYNIVVVLTCFYVLYAYQNIFDSTFYGIGKTEYMLYESIITNVIYYGICFVLYITNIFKPSLMGIVLMFGIGNVFDSVVSGIVYRKHILRS